jgi:anti-anti-sigma regulatory factor
MRFKVQEKGKRGVLFMEGDLTVTRAEELKNALLDALKRVQHVHFNLEKATAVDLSCLQLLCSAHRTAALMNKEFSQSGGNSEAFIKTVTSAGYPRSIGCTEIMAKGCLWIHGK